MQKVAAYLMELSEGMNRPEVRSSKALRLRVEVENWLRSKGAGEIVPKGSYWAQDGGEATFTIEEAVDGDRTWWMVRLQEINKEERRFLAAVSITNGSDRVSVYASLEVGSGVTLVGPLESDPRCPGIVRTLLQEWGPWYHGLTELRSLRKIRGFEAGEGLAEEIKNAERTVPLVVITEGDQGVAIPNLDRGLSYDLAGIANVVTLDPDATWALTDFLGYRLSCHSGAVRLYWPRFSIHEDPYRHPLWTASRLRGDSGDLSSVGERFRRQLRRLVMHASALSVVRPKEIDEIRGNASRKSILDLKNRATSLQDYAELAELYVADYDSLRQANVELENRVDELQSRVAKLESEREALLIHLRSASKGRMLESKSSIEEIFPDADVEDDDQFLEPRPNEVRFYKKRFSAPDRDIMIRIDDCRHNRWQSAHAADKAKKGIAKLEDGRSNWQSLQHCSVCTGGGVWRVRW